MAWVWESYATFFDGEIKLSCTRVFANTCDGKCVVANVNYTVVAQCVVYTFHQLNVANFDDYLLCLWLTIVAKLAGRLNYNSRVRNWARKVFDNFGRATLTRLGLFARKTIAWLLCNFAIYKVVRLQVNICSVANCAFVPVTSVVIFENKFTFGVFVLNVSYSGVIHLIVTRSTFKNIRLSRLESCKFPIVS